VPLLLLRLLGCALLLVWPRQAQQQESWLVFATGQCLV
jgi:hypothetical protein